MPAIITEKFRIMNAQAFVERLQNVTDRYYLGIGKHTPWTIADGAGVDEDNPPFPNSSDQEAAAIWRELYAAKKVEADRIALSIPRYDWVTGETYAQYNTWDESLYRKQFFVLTDQFNVYKCLSNNNETASTVKPTHIGGALTLGDGYRWQYMFTLSPVGSAYFLTPQFMPVSDAVGGSYEVGVTSISVINGGSGYTSAPTLTVNGDGAGATATAIVQGGIIIKVNMTNVGSGYTWATISVGGPGAGALLHANIAPFGGHGSDPKSELGAFYVTINTRLEYDEAGDISTANDFRKLVLIRNPLANTIGNPLYTAGTADQRIRLEVNPANSADIFNYAKDATVKFNGDSTRTATIVEVDTDNNYIYVINVQGTAPIVGNSVDQVSPAVSAPITTIDATKPEMKLYSGYIDYIENRRLVSRAPDQVEEIRITFEW